MAYPHFTLSDIKSKFHVAVELASDVFAAVLPQDLSPLLAETLQENVPLALAVSTEKARSECIVAPILIELRKLRRHQISVFSGVEFTVAPEEGLSGVCDFLVSRSPQQLLIEAPIIVVVEAKNDNLKAGLPQCMATMIAAKLFNEREHNAIPWVYGAVTKGSAWNFLKLAEHTISVDAHEYSIENPGKILGILWHMVNHT
jgi:hypothetical protein